MHLHWKRKQTGRRVKEGKKERRKKTTKINEWRNREKEIYRERESKSKEVWTTPIPASEWYRTPFSSPSSPCHLPPSLPLPHCWKTTPTLATSQTCPTHKARLSLAVVILRPPPFPLSSSSSSSRLPLLYSRHPSTTGSSTHGSVFSFLSFSRRFFFPYCHSAMAAIASHIPTDTQPALPPSSHGTDNMHSRTRYLYGARVDC